MAQTVAYSASEDRMFDSEHEAEIDDMDPWKAAMQGDLDALLQYIDDNGDVNRRDRDNNTPLHWACQESHFDIVGVLMSRSAAVDPVNDLQSTPLHYACREGNLDIVTGLINFNANLEARNKDNLSPLHVAAGMGHIEVTKRLLDNGAHMEAEDNALYTPLWRAAYYGHPEVVEVLLAKGANKLARNKKGRKPGDVFSPTVEEEKKERIKMMLGMGPQQAQETTKAAPQASAAAVTGTAAAFPGGAIMGRGSGAGVATASRAANSSAVKDSGVVAQLRDGSEKPATAAAPPPAYKPPVQERRDPAPSAASLADSAYLYPDPSPANSPSSLLNSTASVMSEAVVAAASRDGASTDKQRGYRGRAGNGGSWMAGKPPAVSTGVGSEATSVAATGVQTTPSVNGSVEIDRLKSELASKNQQLQQMTYKMEEYKENLEKAQTKTTQDRDNADVQVEELNQRVLQAERELENKKREVGDALRQKDASTREKDKQIEQLNQALEQSNSGGCSCTIS